MTEKFIWNSWPQWLTDAIVRAYQEGLTSSQIGAVLQRSEPIVRSKLVHEGVYVSQKDRRKQLKETQQEGF